MSESPVATTRTAAAALALRVHGASYQEVADALQLPDVDVVKDLVERELAARVEDIDPSQRNKQRALAVARIERMMRSVARKATDESDPEHLPAVRAFLSLIDREVRLLGLDAPVEVAVYNPTATEIEAWVLRMSAAAGLVTVGIEEADVIPGEVVRDDEPAA
jgi:hypothetical protein